MTETTTLADRVREALLGAGCDGTPGAVPGGAAFQLAEGVGVAVSVFGTLTDRSRRALLYRYIRALRDAGMTVSDRSERGYVYVHEAGQEPDPVEVKGRVTDVLARHFEDAGFMVTAVTGGAAAIVIDCDRDRGRLAQYAATLRESGFIVVDKSGRGHLYVREHGPEHDIAMAREIAGICRNSYNEHVLHVPGGGKPAEDSPVERFPVRFTVEREGTQYNVIVMPREKG